LAEGTVLVRRRALGDVILLGSVTASLPRPVTVVTEPRYVPLAARLVGVDRAVALGSPVSGRVVDLQRDLRTLLAFPWARRVHKSSLRRWAMLRGLGGGRASVPELYAQACGVRPRPPPWLELPGTPREALALVPGAACAPKQWAPARFVELGRRWGGPVSILGGPGEEALCYAVAAQIPGAVAVCEAGFERTLEALARAIVVVGGDTGLLHLGAAAGARVVALFGPTHPADGFFPYEDGVVIELALPCRPCTRHRASHCAAGHHGCMGQDVPTVLAAVRSCAG
jgi:ADP-heptose:LPS heptosyltransferase